MKYIFLLFLSCSPSFTSRLIVLHEPETTYMKEDVAIQVFDVSYKDTTILVMKKKVAAVTPIHVGDTLFISDKYFQVKSNHY